MIKLRIKPLTVAITSAIMFATLQSYAAGTGDGSGSSDDTAVADPYIEELAKRIKLDYPLGSMEQWLTTPDQFALNPVNIRAGKHPDRDDPNGGPYDVVYIFKDAAAANNWWNGVGTPPNEIPADAVAFIHWELDNGSGTFPGVMSKADIDGFKSKNCIMAAGATIPQPGVKDGIEKTCSNPQGSSKRFKMNVLQADVPIDLVYNVEQADLTYTNYETVPTYNIPGDVPDAGDVPESGRIYRVLQKWHNATAMDAVTTDGAAVPRDGNRIVSFSLELGYGVGDGFNAITNANADGLAPDKELGYELRPCMADHFFNVKRDRPGTGTNPCSDSWDGNGDADPAINQALPQEIWLEEEYSTFSPKMYSFNTDKRTTPVGGWWDKRPAGIYPPETQTMGKLDSGIRDSSFYYPSIPPLRVDEGTLNATNYQGAITGNYFNILEAQAMNYVPDLTLDTNGVIDTPAPFGYLMYFGVLADGDLGTLGQGIAEDADGDPSTEGDLIAWWDGDEYRWGSDPTYDGEIDDDGFAVVPRETLVEWALFPLQEVKDPVTGDWPVGPLYEHTVTDDLAGLNIDSFVYLGREYKEDVNPNFTIRLKAVSVETGLGYVGGEDGNVAAPPWTNPVKELAEYINRDGVIVIRPDIAGQPIVVSLGDLLTGDAPTAVVENLRTGETENITLLQDADNDPILPIYSVRLPTAADGNTGNSNDGTLNVWPLDIVRVTYIDEDNSTGVAVTRTDEAEIPLETLEPVLPTEEDSSGCSCSTSPDGSVDPILPAAVLFALGYLGLRRRESNSK